MIYNQNGGMEGNKQTSINNAVGEWIQVDNIEIYKG